MSQIGEYMTIPQSIKRTISNADVSGPWLDALYQQWLHEPESVGEDWRVFFTGFNFAIESPGPKSQQSHHNDSTALKLSGVQSLIYRYRSIGHLQACTDPLSTCMLEHPLLALPQFDLDQSDLDASFTCRRYLKPRATLREIIDTLRETYCREIGVEFMHIQDPAERQWLIDRMEPSLNRPEISIDDRLNLL